MFISVRLEDEGSWRLLGFTILTVILMITVTLYNHYQTDIDDWWERKSDTRDSKAFKRARVFLRW